MNIPVIYEDDQVVVIDKPAGLVVTPGPGYAEEVTLVGWLINRFGESLRQVGVEGHRPGIVHRLDKDTSGVMVCAKTQAAFLSLINQFKTKSIHKEYKAVAWGSIVDDDKLGWQNARRNKPAFVIDAPIGRNPNDRMKFALVESGKPARTRFKIEKELMLDETPITSLQCFPESGRTHQIRVHLKSMGHGIVGDRIYQGRSERQLFGVMVRDRIIKDRMYLHALQMEFELPERGERKVFVAELPDEFIQIGSR